MTRCRRVALIHGPLALFVAVVAGFALITPLAGLQTRSGGRIENRMLRQASGQMAQGELAEAEATLRELLTLQPGSTAAILALERIFRADGRLPDLLPLLDAFLVQDPSAAEVHRLKIEVLLETGERSRLETAADAWIGAQPASTEAYVESARALTAAYGADRGLALLERGVEVRGDVPQLLVELGDQYVEANRIDDAAEAWARALGRDRAGRGAIFRRIEALGERGVEVAPLVIAALAAEPATVARLEAGAELALRAGLPDEAVSLADAALTLVDVREARGFLNGFARKAEDVDSDASAVWAYGRLLDIAGNAAEARATNERLVESALAAGDTAVAIDALRRIRDSDAPGSPERRSAWTEVVSLEVAFAPAEDAMTALAAFRNEFPEASDLDAIAATLASRLLGNGMRAEALDVLNGIDGPGAAVERAFLLIEGGAFPEGIEALQGALPDLAPAEATEMLGLTLALSELTPVGGQLAAAVAIAKHRGDVDGGIAAVRDRVGVVPDSDRPPILALGARTADQAGLVDVATTFRRRIVDEYPDAREFPEAALRLAQAMATEPGARDEAVRILESLIVSRPNSPIVPTARRELRRIQGEIPQSGRTPLATPAPDRPGDR